MPIRILPPEVANQIAAGEVVERPSSVVKELVENSLDAGASDIRVEIQEGGRRLVRVQDDGCGIPAAEVGLAFQRHATSKISSAADLERITTLGFRGEALASIASVAQVTLLSRARDEEVGALYRVAEGREIVHEPKGAAVGTIITVEHLFTNVPARLKFLKQPATEAGHIEQIVTRYALAYPERRFSLASDGKLIFQSTGSGKRYDVIVKVYGLEMAKQMLEIGESTNQRISESANLEESHSPFAHSLIRVSGYLGTPAMHRSHRGYITLFVNRRWFQDASVAFSVIQAYHTLLPVGRYPVAVIFIEMDPAEVDVNVHPTKAEVRFRDSRAVFSAVQRAAREALVAHAPIPQASLGSAPAGGGGETAPWEGGPSAHAAAFGGPDWAERRDALLSAGTGQQRPLPLQAAGADRQPPDDGLPVLDAEGRDNRRPAGGRAAPAPAPPRRRPACRHLRRGRGAGRHVPD